jgi:hypothetical protein
MQSTLSLRLVNRLFAVALHLFPGRNGLLKDIKVLIRKIMVLAHVRKYKLDVTMDLKEKISPIRQKHHYRVVRQGAICTSIARVAQASPLIPNRKFAPP